MSVYLPPSHINQVYNSADYEYQNGNVTVASAEQRYLSRVGVANSQATLTTFSGSLSFSGTLNNVSALIFSYISNLSSDAQT